MNPYQPGPFMGPALVFRRKKGSYKVEVGFMTLVVI